jgi:hypothetical protein
MRNTIEISPTVRGNFDPFQMIQEVLRRANKPRSGGDGGHLP